ncbi:hypothetical protein ACJMK2_043275, partial [Sinanodonta woodiana]
YLGLTDTYVSVIGLNSSSEDSTNSLSRIGLYNIGWCALYGDRKPFVQVDLLFATTVEGLLVNNRLLLLYGDRKLRNTSYQTGVKTFTVSYGNDTAVLLTYRDYSGAKAK